MIVPDINLLVYAYNSSAPHHDAARAWWQDSLSGRGNVGLVTSILGRATFDASTAVAFVCGPEVMMRFAVFDLLERGITGDRIFLSLERNMHCGIGICGHCQLGPKFVCTDGPVFAYDDVADLLTVRGL